MEEEVYLAVVGLVDVVKLVEEMMVTVMVEEVTVMEEVMLATVIAVVQ